MKESLRWLSCPLCGEDVETLPADEDGLWLDGVKTECVPCGRRLRVSADGERAWLKVVEDD